MPRRPALTCRRSPAPRSRTWWRGSMPHPNPSSSRPRSRSAPEQSQPFVYSVMQEFSMSSLPALRQGVLAAAAVLTLATPAAGAEYYAGKTVDLVVGNYPGGGFDIYA